MKTAMLLVLMALITVSAQDQTPGAADRQTKVRGRVVAADTGQPLVRARIGLLSSASPGRPLMSTSTNAQGVYEFVDVPAAAYFVTASRSGYLEQQYGQRRTRERGLAVTVEAGETIDRIDIALARGGVLAGRITDETGEPYQGLMVTAWETRYQDGRRVRFPAAISQTDDLGAYRITGLAPGSYLLSAVSPETWRNEKNESFGYAATYYPSGAAESAQPLALDSGQQRLSIDFALAAARTSILRGRIVRETGEPLAGAAVQAAPMIRGTGLMIASASPISTTAAADGSFELTGVPPGSYSVRSNAGPGRGTASLAVEVTTDTDNLLLVARTGSTVTGVVVTDNGEPPPFTASGARLSLIAPSPDSVLPTVRVPAINNDWTFTLNNMGGPFLFRLSGFPDEWMLEAVRLNDQDLTDMPFDVPTGGKQVTGLQIVITKDVGKISGAVSADKGATNTDAMVVVFPQDERSWLYGSRYIRMARPNASGNYSLGGLPAGEYFVIAEHELIEGEWEDPQYLKRATARATRLTLKRGESQSLDLKLTPSR